MHVSTISLRKALLFLVSFRAKQRKTTSNYVGLTQDTVLQFQFTMANIAEYKSSVGYCNVYDGRKREHGGLPLTVQSLLSNGLCVQFPYQELFPEASFHSEKRKKMKS